MKNTVTIGFYEKVRSETYAECARITLINKQEKGFCCKITDGILYLYDNEGGLIRIASSFDIEFIND